MVRRAQPPDEAGIVPEAERPMIGLRGAHGRWGAATAMRYPNAYVWLMFVSALDVMLTWRILETGGTEVNPLAAAVIESWGLPGAIAFKFSLMVFVIVVCEVAGRSRDFLGRGLAYLAVAVSSIPVMYSLSLLAYHILVRHGSLGDGRMVPIGG